MTEEETEGDEAPGEDEEPEATVITDEAEVEEAHARKVPKTAEKRPKTVIAEVEPGRPPARTPPTFRQSLMRFVNAMVVSFLLMYFLFPEFSRALVLGADAVLGPLIGFGGQLPIVTLLLAGILTSTVTAVIAHLLTDYVRQARTAKVNSALQKMRFEAMRAKNVKKIEKLSEMQKKMQQENPDMLWGQLKTMGYTMLIILILFGWMGVVFAPSLYTAEGTGKSVFAVPWAPRVELLANSVLPHYILLYSLLAIPFGSILRRLLRYLSFRKRLAALDRREPARVAP